MDKKQATNAIAQLTQKINELNKAYYQKDQPLVSDAEWDKMIRELEALEEKYPELRKKDSPTQRVGAEPLDAFKKFQHLTPMLSLANIMNAEELSAFDQRIKKQLGIDSDEKNEYFCELKFDGLSINLIYVDGYLEHAVTRGDGNIGEEVTNNVRTIKNLPLRLLGKNVPKKIEVRGEIILPIKAFQDLNRERENDGEQLFANPRNAAAGSIRQLDSRLTARRDLSLYAYSIGEYDDWRGVKTQKDLLSQIASWGFAESPQQRVCSGIEEVQKFYEKIEKLREQLEFDIDGVVIKLNDIFQQEELGSVGRSPRAMAAYKFPPRQEKTKLLDIQIQVGRTGVLTPVAILDPVIVHGVRVGRAALHNYEEIQRKDIRIGDTVIVQRAGDVIPEVVSVVLEKRTGKEIIFHFPQNCPSCGNPVIKRDNEVAIRCINAYCPDQIKEGLEHFVSKNAMDIVGLGPRILNQLVEAGLIKSPADLYSLKMEDILSLEGFQERSAEKLLAAIEKSKTKDLASLIYALGIHHVGEQLAKSLANTFKNIDALAMADMDNLLAVEDVGEKVAKSIIEYFTNKDRIKDIERLKALGIHPQKLSIQGATLNNLTFVITGTLPSLSRKQATEIIEKNGGKISNSVGKKTNYLLAGEDAGSKLQKANELKVNIISESELLRMVEGKK